MNDIEESGEFRIDAKGALIVKHKTGDLAGEDVVVIPNARDLAMWILKRTAKCK